MQSSLGPHPRPTPGTSPLQVQLPNGRFDVPKAVGGGKAQYSSIAGAPRHLPGVDISAGGAREGARRHVFAEEFLDGCAEDILQIAPGRARVTAQSACG